MTVRYIRELVTLESDLDEKFSPNKEKTDLSSCLKDTMTSELTKFTTDEERSLFVNSQYQVLRRIKKTSIQKELVSNLNYYLEELLLWLTRYEKRHDRLGPVREGDIVADRIEHLQHMVSAIEVLFDHNGLLDENNLDKFFCEELPDIWDKWLCSDFTYAYDYEIADFKGMESIREWIVAPDPNTRKFYEEYYFREHPLLPKKRVPALEPDPFSGEWIY